MWKEEVGASLHSNDVEEREVEEMVSLADDGGKKAELLVCYSDSMGRIVP